MSSSNKDGLNGLDIEQIALEKTILVGIQAPNTLPAIKTDTNGKSLIHPEISPNGGSQLYLTAGYDCSYADTSWINRIGIYSVASGNTMTFTTGTGGFTWNTDGPSRMKTAYQDFICDHAFSLQTRLFRVNSTQRTSLVGGRLDLDYDKIIIAGNTTFTNNVSINGGLFVNGELYAPHITTQKQIYWTNTSSKSTGYINPMQSFALFQGNSTSALASGFISALITIEGLPDPIGNITNYPCKIKFPMGVSLMSDASNIRSMGAGTALLSTGQITNGSDLPDIIGQGHKHSYYGPAANLKDTTAEVWKDAAKEITKTVPSKSKECIPNGAETLDAIKEELMNTIKDEAMKYFTSFWDDFTSSLSIQSE